MKLLSCLVIRKEHLGKPMHFMYLFQHKLNQLCKKSWTFMLFIGRLRCFSEAASKNLLLTSVSFSKSRALSGCGSFYPWFTICVAQFWNKSILLTRDSIISEIVFYKQYWMKDAIRQLEALLCNFQDLLIYC